MNDISNKDDKLDALSSKWVDLTYSDKPVPSSERLIEWVRRGLPPAQGGPLKVTFKDGDGKTRRLEAIPHTCTPDEFKGALFDGGVLVARMSITWPKDPLGTALFSVEPENNVPANDHYFANDYPLVDGTDIRNFFTALFETIKEQMQTKRP